MNKHDLSAIGSSLQILKRKIEQIDRQIQYSLYELKDDFVHIDDTDKQNLQYLFYDVQKFFDNYLVPTMSKEALMKAEPEDIYKEFMAKGYFKLEGE